MRKTIGIVVPALREGGGVPSVARFLCETIESSEDFICELYSLAVSARDVASVRLTSPGSWFRGPRIVKDSWDGRNYEHVGAVLAELEFQRYCPRNILTQRLEQCDLIQVVAGSPASALVAKDTDVPIALQVATMAALEREERFRREQGLITIWRRLMTSVTTHFERSAVQLVDTIFVENRWMESRLNQITNSGKVVFAPPGVDTAYFHPSRKKDREGESEGEYILSVGRFGDPRKNVRLLFEAYAQLVRHNESVPDLVLVGKSGPRQEDWEFARNRGIGDLIRFHKDVARARLAKLYRKACVFVLTSSEEGLGVVFLEAQASGVPVVATRTKGAESAVEDNVTGLLSPVDDASALADALKRLLADERMRRRMGEAARERAQALFSREVAGQRFLDEYRHLM